VRDSAARALVPALVVLGLVGVVAIAAGGSTPGGTNAARAPSDAIPNTILTLVLVAFIPAAIIYFYGLLHARGLSSKRHPLGSFLGFAIFMFLLTLVVYVRLRNWNTPEFSEGEIGEPAFPGGAPVPQPEPAGRSTYEPEFVWPAVLVLADVVLAGLAVWYVSTRREVRRLAGGGAAEALAAVLDDTLDDLRAEKDARRAVIAAYARLERALAAYGLGRTPAEAPHEYLSRILPRLELKRGSVRRLTELFTRAKFSPHDVDARMKEDAIEALTTVRDELRAADERRRKAELPELETATERP
jgi:hypothetical protein